MTKVLTACLLSGADPFAPRDIVIDGGIIASISPAARSPAHRLVAMPALANAHDHCRPLSPTSFGAANKPLETWLLKLGAMPAIDPYLGALAAFGRAARAGAPIAGEIDAMRPPSMTMSCGANGSAPESRQAVIRVVMSGLAENPSKPRAKCKVSAFGTHGFPSGATFHSIGWEACGRRPLTSATRQAPESRASRISRQPIPDKGILMRQPQGCSCVPSRFQLK